MGRGGRLVGREEKTTTATATANFLLAVSLLVAAVVTLLIELAEATAPAKIEVIGTTAALAVHAGPCVRKVMLD